MRRLLLRRSALLFAALFAIALIATAPLRLALGALDTGLSARAARGSVWRGELVAARVGGVLLGDLKASLSPAALLVGQVRMTAMRAGGGPARPLRATLAFSGAMRAVEGLNGTVPIDRLAEALPPGALAFDNVTVRFQGGRCVSAQGLIRAELADPAPMLAGAARCDKGVLLIPFASANAAERIALTIAGDGRVEIR